MKKKVVIVSTSFGNGHNQVARACKDAFDILFPQHHTIVLDLLQERTFLQGIKTLYLEIVKKTPSFYSKAYQWSRNSKRVSSGLFILCSKSLKKIRETYKPDVFVFTHPFPIAAYRCSLDVPAWGIITDLNFHASWFNPQIYGYFVANSYVASSLQHYGYPTESIFCTGIPISPQFSRLRSNEQWEKSLHQLGIKGKKPLLLIMGGGLGLGALEEATSIMVEIESCFEGVILTGKNYGIQKYLQAKLGKRGKDWVIVPYTNRVPYLMYLARLLITKAGAVTLCEASASSLPTVIYRPLPGQEIENARFVEQQGWVRWPKNKEELKHITLNILTNLQLREVMSRLARENSNPHAALKVAHIIFEQLQLPLGENFYENTATEYLY